MKQNAANTPMLAVIKRQFNAKIYKHCLAIFNDTPRDTQAAIDFLQQFDNRDMQAWLIAETDKEIRRRADDRARCFRHLIR